MKETFKQRIESLLIEYKKLLYNYERMLKDYEDAKCYKECIEVQTKITLLELIVKDLSKILVD